MAFDHENHAIDPATGFQVHKKSGHRIGIDPAPAQSVHLDPEWPKWIEPHAGHIDRTNDHISVPHFEHHHVERGTNKVTVLVHNEADEARAMAEPVAPQAETAERPSRRRRGEHTGE